MEKGYFSFKKLFWSYIFCGIPLALLVGLLALLHISAVYFNELPIYGFKGFVIPILFMPLFALLFAGANWVILNIGYYLYNAFIKAISNKNNNLDKQS